MTRLANDLYKCDPPRPANNPFKSDPCRPVEHLNIQHNMLALVVLKLSSMVNLTKSEK